MENRDTLLESYLLSIITDTQFETALLPICSYN